MGLRSFHDCPATQLKGSMDCSGLVILSRHEIIEVDFIPFEQNHGKNFVEVSNLGVSNSLARQKDNLSLIIIDLREVDQQGSRTGTDPLERTERRRLHDAPRLLHHQPLGDLGGQARSDHGYVGVHPADQAHRRPADTGRRLQRFWPDPATTSLTNVSA